MTVDSYILYLNLHRKHLCKEGRRSFVAWFAYAAAPRSERECQQRHRRADSFIVKVRKLNIQCKCTHTIGSLSCLFFFSFFPFCQIVLRRSGWGGGGSSRYLRLRHGLLLDVAAVAMRPRCVCASMCHAHVDSPSFFVVSPFPRRSSNIPVKGFYVLSLSSSLSLSPPSTLLSSLCGVSGKVFQESSINVRAEEPRVRVSFHQPVNYLLSIVKAVHGGSLDVPFDLLSGVIVNVDLFWRFCLDELFVNLLGSRGHPERRLDLLVVLTGEPEFNVLIAVFGFEKVAKGSQSIFRLEEPFQ